MTHIKDHHCLPACQLQRHEIRSSKVHEMRCCRGTALLRKAVKAAPSHPAAALQIVLGTWVQESIYRNMSVGSSVRVGVRCCGLLARGLPLLGAASLSGPL